MSRLNQIIRNLYIRLEGLVYQVFGVFNKLFGWLNQGFKFLGKLFGFSSSQYLVETDEAQAIKAATEPELTAAAPQSSPAAASTTRRRPDPSMDYYLKMAQKEKKGKKAT